MKTIRRMDLKDGLIEYKRVSDEFAEQKVQNENWEYCPKSEWKNNVRDINKKKE